MKKLLNRDEYTKIQKEVYNTSVKKNADYGCDTILKFGVRGLVIRLYDKMERLINLTEPGYDAKVKDESIEDTAKDMINYATYIVMLHRNKLVDENGKNNN